MKDMISPQARQTGLLIHQLGDEVVVYDEEQHRIHALNPTAALVWNHCDGKTSVSDITAQIAQKSNTPGDEYPVWLALAQLQRAGLLLDVLPRTVKKMKYSRR